MWQKRQLNLLSGQKPFSLHIRHSVKPYLRVKKKVNFLHGCLHIRKKQLTKNLTLFLSGGKMVKWTEKINQKVLRTKSIMIY